MPPQGEKRKESGHHKRSSKSGSSKSQKTDIGGPPDKLAFLWEINAVVAVYDGGQPRKILGVGSSKDNVVAKLWFPPSKKNQFRFRQGNLFRWVNGYSELAGDTKRPKKEFSVASVFFQDRQDNFVVSPRDCTQHDLGVGEHIWYHLAFHHHVGNLSEVDFAAAQHAGLSTPVARDSTWMPEVLPEVYNYRKRAGSRHKEVTGPPGGLCGKLSILIGMAAFSAEVDDAEEVVRDCFGYKEWTGHGHETGIGRYEGRGAIIKIFLDPSTKDCTERHLEAFEQGKYGPIFQNSGPTDHDDEGPEPSYHTASEYGPNMADYSASINYQTAFDVVPRTPQDLSGQPAPSYARLAPPSTGPVDHPSAPLSQTSVDSPDVYGVSDEDDLDPMEE